jgi:hypothetical protein
MFKFAPGEFVDHSAISPLEKISLDLNRAERAARYIANLVAPIARVKGRLGSRERRAEYWPKPST